MCPCDHTCNLSCNIFCTIICIPPVSHSHLSVLLCPSLSPPFPLFLLFLPFSFYFLPLSPFSLRTLSNLHPCSVPSFSPLSHLLPLCFPSHLYLRVILLLSLYAPSASLPLTCHPSLFTAKWLGFGRGDLHVIGCKRTVSKGSAWGTTPMIGTQARMCIIYHYLAIEPRGGSFKLLEVRSFLQKFSD